MNKKRILLIIFLIFFIVGVIYFFYFQYNFANVKETQSTMIAMARNDYEKNNNKLTTIYNRILKTFSKDRIFTENLKISQSDWVKLRNSQYKTLFPEEDIDISYSYGSNFDIYSYTYQSELTNQRVNDLKTLVKSRCFYLEDKYSQGECSDKSIKNIFE